MKTTALAPAPAGRRTWLGLAVLVLPVLLVTIDNTVLNFAMPSIAADLRPGAALQLWLIDAYPLVLCSLLVAGGNLGDRFGRRRTLMIGLTGFALASLGAAFAPTAEVLLVGRIVTGVFGAVILPATHSLLRNMFHVRTQRRLAIAIWSTGFAAGAALGPILGGWLVGVAAWPAVFLIAVPFAVVLLIVAPLLLSESRDPEPGSLDLWSIVLSALALGPVVAAVKRAADSGPDALSWALAVIGVTAAALFVRRMLTAVNPMLDLRLLRRVGFAGPILVNLVSIASLTGFLFYAAQHLQLIVGLSPLEAAWTMAPGALANIIAGLAVVKMVKVVRPATAIAAGLLCSTAAYTLTAISSGSASLATICLAYILIGIGVGSAETLAGDMLMANIEPDKAGAASAMSETAYELGTVLGVTVFGGILTATYRSGLVVPEGMTPIQADAARATLSGAHAIAETLPTTTGEALMRAAGSAFDSGVLTTSTIGAVLMVAAATFVLTALRRENG